MNFLEELMRITRKRALHFEREAKRALTYELETVYRAKADEAYSIYSIILEMRRKILKERSKDECENT